jgi:heme-degrading monooxygenase HmoA
MLVTLDIWRVRRRGIALAFLYMALHRRVRRLPGCTFVKLLGTGTGRTFTPRDADAQQWAILAVWSDRESAANFRRSSFPSAWARIAFEHAEFDLTPLSSHGRWSGKEPFGTPAPRTTDKPVVAITRARIAWRKNLTFWRAVPPVTMSLHSSPGLVEAIGIGEAPLGLQGTFSLWRTDGDLRAFAYKGAEHAEAIRRTSIEGWYSEELFARLEVERAHGVLRGIALGAQERDGL